MQAEERARAMLDGTPQTVGQWLEAYLGHVITICGAFIVFVIGYTKLGDRVSNSEREQARLSIRVEGVEKDVDEHCSDTRKHIDPERDERRWQSMEQMLREIHTEMRQRRKP
jgi:flagellar biosynthesis/type III secretory pathway M-ring protein FliF/YscJ